MKNDSIKKYLIPNIPYLFVLWAFLKLGTAYRLAAGADFAHKLMGLGQTIGPTFADFAPGLAPFDWLVGIVGAVAFRVMVYVKSKNAKKFRRDEEYGSARWGCPKDIAPFVDPKFENNIILTGTEFLTMNTRPKNPANARNLNACVIGSSGSGKTRFWLTPQILQASADKNGGCSYVCVDPKGGVLGQAGHFLQKRGYRIKVFNSIDFTKSMHYNPLAYIRNEADILKFVDALISNTKGEGKEGDPFWTKSETLLYCALIAYIIFEGPAEDRNMNTLVDMISGMEVKEDDEDFMNAVDYMFAGLEKRKPDCFAVKQYKKVQTGQRQKQQSRSLFPAVQGWLPLTSPSLGRSWPMTSWSLTASGIEKRRCSLSSRTLRKPIISLWLWPFRRCSICCARGPTMFTEAACPIMYGCCGTRPPTQGRFPSLKRSWLSSVPVRSA